MQIVKTKVTQGGRIVIPAEMRKRLGIKIGENVNLIEIDNELKVTTGKEALRRLQNLVKDAIPSGVSIVDELISERRKEAQNE